MDTTIIDASAGIILCQGISSLSGLFGGLSTSFFWRPKKLHQHGRLTAGLIIGSISVSTSFAFAGLASRWLGMNISEIDIALGLGYVIGAISVGAIAWLGNFFSRREDQDLLQIISGIRDTSSWSTPLPMSPPPTSTRVLRKAKPKKEKKDECNL